MEAGIKGKRHFCVIRDYKEYLEMEKQNKYDFDQILIHFGTNDYANFALDLWQGDIKGLQERLDPLFEKYDWT